MLPTEPSSRVIDSVNAQTKGLTITIMNMSKDLKEDINKSLMKSVKLKQWNEIMNTVQIMKVQIESLKKT